MSPLVFPILITAGVGALLVAKRASDTLPARVVPDNGGIVPMAMYKAGDTVKVPADKLPPGGLPAFVLDAKNFPLMPGLTGLYVKVSTVTPTDIRGMIVGVYYEGSGRLSGTSLPNNQQVGPITVPLTATAGIA